MTRRFSIDPARVERYRAARKAALAAAHRAFEEAHEASENLTHLKQEASRIQGMGRSRAERTEVRPDVAERIAQAEADVARLRKAQALTNERATHAGRIWTAIEEHIGDGPRKALMSAGLDRRGVTA